jgi:serine O-acetyltransferase
MAVTAMPADWRTSLRADTHRLYGRWSPWLCLRGALTSRTFRVLLTLRLTQSRCGWLAAPLHKWTCARAGIDLPRNTAVGPGLAINHGWGLVISPGARIGKNVTLFHGVTLGRRDRIDASGARTIEFPTIEDSVCIGPHAVIVGGITVGCGSRIAAGAFVTDSVPAHCVVQGNPAQIVKQQCQPDVMNPVA